MLSCSDCRRHHDLKKHGRSYDPKLFQKKLLRIHGEELMHGTICPESELNVAEGDLTTEFMTQSFSDGVFIHGVQMNGDHFA